MSLLRRLISTFVRNGSQQDVVQDTVTPSNNRPFPTDLYDSGGQRGTVSNALRTDPTGTTSQPITASSLPLPSGAATEATLATRLSETDFDNKIGSLTETAPATDTASSGLNGRLQRIAQRLTSLIGLFPVSLVGGRFDINIGSWFGSTAPTVGQKTMASSLPVTIASDQAVLSITTNDYSTGNLNGFLTPSLVAQQVWATSTTRKSGWIVNNSNKDVWIAFSISPVPSSFLGFELKSGDAMIIKDECRLQVQAVWESTSGVSGVLYFATFI